MHVFFRISKVKFHLNLQDEGDAQHWLFATAATGQSPTPLNEEKLKEEDEQEEETQVVDDDFANPIPEENFTSIPIIDLSQPPNVYAQQIGDACRNVGFFYIINHGVEQEVIDSALDVSKKFFALDLRSKLEVSNCNNDEEKKSGYRGYFDLGGEDLDNKDGTRDLVAEEGGLSKDNTSKRGDHKEGFDCGNEDSFFGRNIWPDEINNPSITGFQKTLMKYQDALIVLSDKLLLALGQSLGTNIVAEDYFLQQSRNPMCTLRMLHYPATDDGLSKSQGCGAHTDYGLFTILQQDSIGGLQVRNKAKDWINATPLKGSFVINCGDMLSHWTNGEYSSTVHRVVSPSTSGDRYSVPFFFNPDANAVVKPLKSVRSDSGDNTGDAKRALDILKARYDGTF